MSIPEISALAERISRTSPWDKDEQREILERICELRSLMERGSATDLAAYLDVAAHLGEYLIAMDGIGPREICSIQARILRVVQDSFQDAMNARDERARAQAASAAEAAAHASDALPMGEPLRLISDLLLGEILVQLGVVSGEDIDEAMGVQRAEGARLGEALVQMGRLTKEEVQNAVRIQRDLRNAAAVPAVESDESAAPRPTPTATSPSLEAESERELSLVSDVLLGELLVRSGRVSIEQVGKALRVQRATGMRIGEALVQGKAVTWAAIEEALDAQDSFRRAQAENRRAKSA